MISVLRNLIVVSAILFGAWSGTAEPPARAEKPSHPHGFRKDFRRRPGPPREFFAKLTPQERAEVDRLAREGRKEELGKLMKELFFKYRPEEMKQLDALSERYLKTSDEKERVSIRQEMEKLTRILFRKRQNFTRNNIAEAEKQLERAQRDLQRLKNHYQHNEENQEKIIAARVDRLCLPPEKRPKPGWKKRPPHKSAPPENNDPAPAK